MLSPFGERVSMLIVAWLCDVLSIHFFFPFWQSKHRKKYSQMTNGDSPFLFSWLLSVSMPFVVWTISPLHWFGGTPFQKQKGPCNSLFSLHNSWSEVLVLGLANWEYILKE